MERKRQTGYSSKASKTSDYAMDGGQFPYWDPHGWFSKVKQQEKTETDHSSLIDVKKPTIAQMQKELSDSTGRNIKELQILRAIKARLGCQ